MPQKPHIPVDLHPALTQGGDPFDLVLAGERVDGRLTLAKRFRALGSELVVQMGNTVTPAEKMLLRCAATFAVLLERDTARLLEGDEIDQEGYRRNAQALGAVLVKLGLAMKSRDVTKSHSRALDAHAAAILDADE